MFIQELVLEGFKSYATRTVVSGWDPAFNAITGLNGSGKSNILDAICFVLGISSLSHVRATSLQDLVYKKGQAGITKASVTIIFNNEERDKSPLGYENCKEISITRQIIVGGRNKYIVNGHNKNQQDVANLFQSVQLNVNNPHFLIMQGKITKVLNMKPPEILAMIEEAAGTRMFEDRKEKALKTIEKKDAKLMEITSILEHEIGPKFNKLREAKRAFLEYQELGNELGFLSRLIAAYEFVKYQDTLGKATDKLTNTDETLDRLGKSNQFLEEDLIDLDEKIAAILEKRAQNSGKFAGREAEHSEASKALVVSKTQLDLKNTSIKDEKNALKSLHVAKQELLAQLTQSKLNCEQRVAAFKSQKSDFESKIKELQKLEELFQTLSVGMAASEGQDNGYMDQLREAKKQGSLATSEVGQIKIRIDHLKKELAEATPKAKKAEKQNASLISEFEASKKFIDALKADIGGIDFNPEHEATLLEQLENEAHVIYQLESKLDELERSLQGLSFKYSDPTPNFDRSKVKGLVAELVEVDKDRRETATALEVCAGGKLYNVVVETEVVGTQLLQKGQLRKRVTIIPLNKISSFQVQAERIATAKKVAPGAVDLALHLVGYDQELLPAISYVFGSTLICKDPATAKAVTFNKDVRLRSVTLDGDTYDPSGQLSGGSRPNSAGILLRMGELLSLKSEISKHYERKKALTEELDELQMISKHYKGLVQKLELKEHAHKLLEERFASNASSQMIQHVLDLKTQIAEQTEALTVANEKRSTIAEECVRIEKEIKEFSSNRDAKIKSLQKQITECKAVVAAAGPAVQEIQLQIDILKGEVSQLEKESVVLDEQIASADRVLLNLDAERTELANKVASLKETFDKVDDELKKEKKSLASFDKEVSGFEKEKRAKKQELENGKLEMQRLGHDRQGLVSERDASSRHIEKLLSENPWIPDQKGTFGQEGSNFYFGGQDMNECHKRLVQIQERHNKLSKSLDTDVMQKYERLEKKESTLKQMFSTVKKDKKKIEDTIVSLEEYKRVALVKTWNQVNKDFGLIFGDLLPGNTSKLEPSEGKDITDGLEVRVCLGGVWKQSLTELSGGQRSLIALSLILSLLQFKPAPMYILDEVDSALDLSHTQNIGHLLRTRFKGSQFIIVSLKDGMFNNANVLFRTKFRDGVSTVDRIVQRSDVQPVPTKSKQVPETAARSRRAVAA